MQDLAYIDHLLIRRNDSIFNLRKGLLCSAACKPATVLLCSLPIFFFSLSHCRGVCIAARGNLLALIGVLQVLRQGLSRGCIAGKSCPQRWNFACLPELRLRQHGMLPQWHSHEIAAAAGAVLSSSDSIAGKPLLS